MSTADVAARVLNPGHPDRSVMVLEGPNGPFVRKHFSSDDGAAQFDALQALWKSPFGAERRPPGLPRPIAYHHQERALDMQFVEGRPVDRRGEIAGLRECLDAVAALVAGLHTSGVCVERRRDPAKLLRWLQRRLPDDPALVTTIANTAPATHLLVPSHGDCSPQNVLRTAAGPVMIDFDRLQMASPALDLGYLAAWCWITQVHGAEPPVNDPWSIGDSFEVAYRRYHPAADGALAAGRRFHRAVGLVRVATEWSAMRADPAASAMVLAEARRLVT